MFKWWNILKFKIILLFYLPKNTYLKIHTQKEIPGKQDFFSGGQINTNEFFSI